LDPHKLTAMSGPVDLRRIVALIAAYIIALQALLLPLSVAAGGSLGSSHCSSMVSVGSSGSPVDRDNGCPCGAGCGMQCGVHALAGPPQVSFARLDSGAGAAAPLPAIAAAVRPIDRGPQSPRGPPFA